MIDQTKISRDLAEIIDLELALLGQAVNDANATIDKHSLPGGLAMVSLAPVARLSKWTDRVIDLEKQWARENPGAPIDRRPDWTADEDDDWEPALQTLRFWSDHYRRVLGMQYDLIPTIATEAKFLRHETVLPWIVAHEPNVEVFAQDVNAARRRLENIVYAGDRTERTRIVCNHCDKKPQLVKVYSSRKVSNYSCLACDTPIGLLDLDHCPNPMCWSVAPAVETGWISDIDKDSWKCPSCKHRYDADALRRAHAQQLRHESASKFLPWHEARATLVTQGRAERTIRKWMSPQVKEVDACTVCRRRWPPQEYAACPRKIKRRGEWTGERCGGELTAAWHGDREAVVLAYSEVSTHRLMVWWPDLWSLHLKTTRRSTVAS